ncbi:MAG: SH3 domain-containing protein [Methyloceanibacter sp.]
MKGLLLLGLVGAAIYGALVLSDNLLPRDPAKDAFAGQSLGNPSDRQLRSWGTDLPALTSSSFPESALPSPKTDVTPASSRSASSEAKPTTTQADGTYQPIEWARVVLAAKVHGDASVSSPTLRFYQPGTALQVVSRQNGWVQITDPASGERGWVFEQYLVPADGPTATQTAMVTTASKPAAEPTRAIAKKRVGASGPAARTPDKFTFAQFDRRWERRAARRGGLFFFGRFARAE